MKNKILKLSTSLKYPTELNNPLYTFHSKTIQHF